MLILRRLRKKTIHNILWLWINTDYKLKLLLEKKSWSSCVAIGHYLDLYISSCSLGLDPSLSSLLSKSCSLPTMTILEYSRTISLYFMFFSLIFVISQMMIDRFLLVDKNVRNIIHTLKTVVHYSYTRMIEIVQMNNINTLLFVNPFVMYFL